MEPTRVYGWQPSPPDFRDHVYTVPDYLAAAPLPAFVDLTATAPGVPFDPCWDQKNRGSCGPHSAGENIVLDSLMAGVTPPMPSRLFVYFCTRALMGTVNQDSGVDNRTMLKALSQYGWCDESLWPYDTNRFTEQPPAACFEQAKARTVSRYLSVPQDLDTMKACLAGGRPFIAGFSVYESFEGPGPAANGVIPMPSPSEQRLGGHDVLVVGYDDASGHFKFRNHWYNSNGKPWGRVGYGFFPFQYLTNPQLSGDFWCIQASGLPDAPPIVPPSPPDPTPAPVVPPAPPAPGPGPFSTHTFSVSGQNVVIMIDGRVI